jgi:hypothetical protein
MKDVVFDPILPMPVIVLLGAALLYLTVRIYLRVGADVGTWRKISLLAFRLCGLALIVMLLLQPSKEEHLPPPTQERVTVVGLDSSLSMKQKDADRTARLDAARTLLLESGAVDGSGLARDPHLRLFNFADDAAPVPNSVLELGPGGKSTRLHSSVSRMLDSSQGAETAKALILLTDGHDFELVNPVKTGTAARNRGIPIYAVPFGKQGKVRDVSARITSFQPYCYVKQKARVGAALRLIGCEYEEMTVQLLRLGQIVQTRRVNGDELQELPVEFEVAEPEVGQFEFEVRVLPLENEVDSANNSAITYLNVIDQQIRVLILEGDPYWDTTFLQRSLLRNDKFDVEALLRYGKERVRAIRKSESKEPLTVPENLKQWAKYDVVILGRKVDSLLTEQELLLLDQYVRDRNGTLIFSRGPAFEKGQFLSELEPVQWSDPVKSKARLDVTAEGRGVPAFRGLNTAAGGLETLPEMVAGHLKSEAKPLTSTLAVTGGSEAQPAPAIVHRRYGQGQAVSVGVEGLWRWSLNAGTEGRNTPFDRFWDQFVLWLLASRDFVPSKQFSFRPNSANVMLGEKAVFRLRMRQPDPQVKAVPLTIFYGDTEVGRISMAGSASDPDRLTGEFLPGKTGRYRALARFPDGTSQESRFIVFSENLEETEVATDTLGLRRLCESSGGRLIEPGEFARLLNELKDEKVEMTTRTKLRPMWNEASVFYLTGALLGLDWFLRRRWGLS